MHLNHFQTIFKKHARGAILFVKWLSNAKFKCCAFPYLLMFQHECMITFTCDNCLPISQLCLESFKHVALHVIRLKATDKRAFTRSNASNKSNNKFKISLCDSIRYTVTFFFCYKTDLSQLTQLLPQVQPDTSSCWYGVRSSPTALITIQRTAIET